MEFCRSILQVRKAVLRPLLGAGVAGARLPMKVRRSAHCSESRSSQQNYKTTPVQRLSRVLCFFVCTWAALALLSKFWRLNKRALRRRFSARPPRTPPLAMASSLVKYDNPVLVTSSKKKRGGKIPAAEAKVRRANAGHGGTPALSLLSCPPCLQQQLTATEDILNSILPPRCVLIACVA